ncbi:hypothetical protein ARMGADRAFT_1075003 [Armillaria gallica]|uniref:Uncharacterized protein n=1 Tax=Armillaria gallica TaxID=47427 RepID=A0A2H3DW94_ARMGA|nr:hypothetical protein ARMGADRAFT_1075003 [Armillaria gallica]
MDKGKSRAEFEYPSAAHISPVPSTVSQGRSAREDPRDPDSYPNPSDEVGNEEESHRSNLLQALLLLLVSLTPGLGQKKKTTINEADMKNEDQGALKENKGQGEELANKVNKGALGHLAGEEIKGLLDLQGLQVATEVAVDQMDLVALLIHPYQSSKVK